MRQISPTWRGKFASKTRESRRASGSDGLLNPFEGARVAQANLMRMKTCCSIAVLASLQGRRSRIRVARVCPLMHTNTPEDVPARTYGYPFSASRAWIVAQSTCLNCCATGRESAAGSCLWLAWAQPSLSGLVVLPLRLCTGDSITSVSRSAMCCAYLCASCSSENQPCSVKRAETTSDTFSCTPQQKRVCQMLIRGKLRGWMRTRCNCAYS